MNMQRPDFPADQATPGEPEPGLSRIFIKSLLQSLSGTLPASAGADPEAWAEQWEAARELFYALRPRDPVEAVLAARVVTAHHAMMDMNARAALPGATDEKVLRLRASAAAASRSFDVAMRTLEKRQKPAAEPATQPAAQRQPKRGSEPPRRASSQVDAAPAPDDEPLEQTEEVSDLDFFQPRDRHGNPIPNWRYEWMTMAQRRATYCYPRNPELEAEAIAEEEKMIAEQAEMDRRQAETPDSEPPC